MAEDTYYCDGECLRYKNVRHPARGQPPGAGSCCRLGNLDRRANVPGRPLGGTVVRTLLHRDRVATGAAAATHVHSGGLQGGPCVSRQASSYCEGRRVGEGPVGDVTAHPYR